MGQRIRRPSAFQGLTKKEAKTGNVPEGDFVTRGYVRRELDHMESIIRDIPQPSRRQQRNIIQRQRTEGNICQ
eukprot:2223506-Heterocapsa_arctica.AAC.1